MKNEEFIKEYTVQKNGINIKVRTNKPSQEALNAFANEAVSLYKKIQDRKEIA